MIPANELRIGNWVYDTRSVSEYHAKNKMQVKEINDKIYKHLEPIPLTIELLSNCGLQNGVFPTLEYFSIDEDFSICFEGAYTACDIKYLHRPLFCSYQ